MNTAETPGGTNNNRHTVEAHLNQTLRDDGRLFPETAEDLEAVMEDTDSEEVEPIPTERLLARIRGNAHESEDTNVISLDSEQFQAVADDMLAMAARNGDAIPDSVRQQMDKDRKQAEAERE